MMKRTKDSDTRRRVDLGRASELTKGPIGVPVEFGGLQPRAGISDE